jgi:WD40 repeat protein
VTKSPATFTLQSKDKPDNGFIHDLSTTHKVLIGREADCQIVVDSNKYSAVSRRHAEIELISGSLQPFWQICDLNTANGTYINGQRLQGCHRLQTGDRIMLSNNGPEYLFEDKSASLPTPTPALQPVVAASSVNQIPHVSSTPTQPPVQNQSPAVQAIHPSTGKSLWNLNKEQSIRVLVREVGLVRAVALNADGTVVASTADKTIKLWNFNTGEEICTFSGHRLAVNGLAFSNDGKILISGSADKTIKLWNLETRQEISTLSGHSMAINAVAISYDGSIIASCSMDKTIKLWQLATGQEISTLSGHRLGVTAVAITPNGQILASASADKTIKFWHLNSKQEIATLPGLRSTVNSLIFSPDGQFIASSGEDKMLKLWNPSTHKEIRTIAGYGWQVGTVAISRDGQTFISGSEDKMIKIWHL